MACHAKNRPGSRRRSPPFDYATPPSKPRRGAARRLLAALAEIALSVLIVAGAGALALAAYIALLEIALRLIS